MKTASTPICCCYRYVGLSHCDIRTSYEYSSISTFASPPAKTDSAAVVALLFAIRCALYDYCRSQTCTKKYLSAASLTLKQAGASSVVGVTVVVWIDDS